MNGHYPKPGGLAAALAVLIAVVLAACSPKGAAGGDAACRTTISEPKAFSKRFPFVRRSSTR